MVKSNVEVFLIMKKSFLFITILFVAVSSVFSQTKSKTVSQIPEIEPFRISRGSSFSASRTNPNRNPTFTGRDKISKDVFDALEIIEQNHVDGKKVDYNNLIKSSISSMLHTLDPHSNYFDPGEFNDLLTDQRSEYFGIGTSIANYTKGGKTDTFIVSPFPDSPAFRANLRFGDKIIAVDGENISDKSSAYVRDRVRGAKGTVVRLTIERAGSDISETVSIRRNRVPQPSIPDAYMLREGIGYIDLSDGFNYTTDEELTVALDELHKQGMKSLILDLRGNPGGILEQAVRVAEKFLPYGKTIVSQRGRFSLDNRVWKSRRKTSEKLPLVVLVNENSASASEIVAGALQDYDRALIVGDKTFGKGLVQSIINLPYEAGLTLTTAKYYTPSGRSIQRDYSDGNLYDYFNHKKNLTEKERTKFESKTAAGRKVFGGDGIEPDELVKTKFFNSTQIALLDPVFFFSRKIAGGKMKGFENYANFQTVRFGQKIRTADLPVNDELFAEFKKYVTKNWQISASSVETEKEFIKMRLRYNLAVSVFGNVAANQTLIESDPQIAKAVEVLPKAQQLAVSANKWLQK